VLVPPPPETLKIIRDLVAGVTGFNQERGDQLVIETLPFESTLLLEPPSLPPGAAKPGPAGGWTLKWDRNTLLLGGGVAAGVIVLGFLAAMLLRGRKGRRVSAENTGPAALPAAAAAQAAGAGGSDLEQQIESKLAERDALKQKMEQQALSSLKLAPVITKTAEVLAKHIREKVKDEPELSGQILRGWIREEDN
jgi:flagellar biosynthesis/type III secretory pathway M-ring protein FliF/YscJ